MSWQQLGTRLANVYFNFIHNYYFQIHSNSQQISIIKFQGI